MTNDEVVADYRDQVAQAVIKVQVDSLDPIVDSLILHHGLGGLGQILASSWAIQAAKAWQEIQVAMAVGLWRIPRAAVAEAMGLAGSTNFKTQFPQLEEIMETLRREMNTGQKVTLIVRGFTFTVGPVGYAYSDSHAGERISAPA